MKHILSIAFVITVVTHNVNAGINNDIEEDLNIGQAFISKGDPDRAIWWLNGVIDLNKDNAKAYLLRAEAYLLIDRYPLAYEDMQKAILIDPSAVNDLMFKKKNIGRNTDIGVSEIQDRQGSNKTVSSEWNSSNKWFEDE